MLTIDRVSKHFGGVYANRDVSMEVPDGELRGVIGPNGAGKSTLFNLVAGHLRPDSGSISIDGRPLDRMPPHVRATQPKNSKKRSMTSSSCCAPSRLNSGRSTRRATPSRRRRSAGWKT